MHSIRHGLRSNHKSVILTSELRTSEPRPVLFPIFGELAPVDISAVRPYIVGAYMTEGLATVRALYGYMAGSVLSLMTGQV